MMSLPVQKGIKAAVSIETTFRLLTSREETSQRKDHVTMVSQYGGGATDEDPESKARNRM